MTWVKDFTDEGIFASSKHNWSDNTAFRSLMKQNIESRIIMIC